MPDAQDVRDVGVAPGELPRSVVRLFEGDERGSSKKVAGRIDYSGVVEGWNSKV